MWTSLHHAECRTSPCAHFGPSCGVWSSTLFSPHPFSCSILRDRSLAKMTDQDWGMCWNWRGSLHNYVMTWCNRLHPWPGSVFVWPHRHIQSPTDRRKILASGGYGKLIQKQVKRNIGKRCLWASKIWWQQAVAVMAASCRSLWPTEYAQEGEWE